MHAKLAHLLPPRPDAVPPLAPSFSLDPYATSADPLWGHGAPGARQEGDIKVIHA